MIIWKSILGLATQKLIWALQEGVCAEAEEDPWRVLESEARLASGEPALKPEDRHVFPEYQLQTDYEEEPSAVSSRHGGHVS